MRIAKGEMRNAGKKLELRISKREMRIVSLAGD
jgi:hypothetical protein